ncbi:hypothetical protein CAEBREN_08018 [Caenorhabditis brenneri]|uniref:Uncharacterized protein n=1 Tax=Caenorhabditis brenneri TaxID=135651 RepID=G0P1J1_CAEBE|nr:hypothetical protein CAEBREN_08018 [Caenorhabditis brenneri]
MPRIEAVSTVVRENCGHMSKRIALIVRGHIKDHRKMSQRRVIDQYQVNTHQYSEENEERFKFILNSRTQVVKDSIRMHQHQEYQKSQDICTPTEVSVDVTHHHVIGQSTHSSSSTKSSFGRYQDKEQSCSIKTGYRKMNPSDPEEDLLARSRLKDHHKLSVRSSQSSWFSKSHITIGHPGDKVKEMSHHQLNSQKDKPIKVEDHATVSRHTKAAKDQFRSTEVELAKQGHVNPEVAKHKSQGLSMKLKLRRKAQRNRRATTVVQKKEASAHSPEESLRSPRSPTTSCQEKLKQTRRYQSVHHQQNTQARIAKDEDNISQLVSRNGAEAIINTCKDLVQTKKPTRRVQKAIRNSTQHEDSTTKDTGQRRGQPRGIRIQERTKQSSLVRIQPKMRRIDEDHKAGADQGRKTPVKEVYQARKRGNSKKKKDRRMVRDGGIGRKRSRKEDVGGMSRGRKIVEEGKWSDSSAMAQVIKPHLIRSQSTISQHDHRSS